jgi:hypothetical protein
MEVGFFININKTLKEILYILEHYHYDLSNDYRLHKTKDILFDNLSESVKYRIKEIITIYNINLYLI